MEIRSEKLFYLFNFVTSTDFFQDDLKWNGINKFQLWFSFCERMKKSSTSFRLKNVQKLSWSQCSCFNHIINRKVLTLSLINLTFGIILMNVRSVCTNLANCWHSKHRKIKIWWNSNSIDSFPLKFFVSSSNSLISFP